MTRRILRTRAFAALLFFIATAFSPLALALPTIERFTTANGVRVDFVASREQPLIDVVVSFDAGSARDPEGKEGLASLTRQLLDTSTRVHDEQGLSDAFADLAVSLSGSVDEDRATVAWRNLSEAQVRDAAADLVAEVLTQPIFSPAIFIRERANAKAALKDALTRPEVLSERTFTANVYRDHPYGKLPTLESLDRITREDLIAFHRAYYTRAAAHVAIVGDLDRAQAEQLADRITAKLPAGEAPKPLPPVAQTQAHDERIAHPAQQAHLRLGLAVMTRDDPDYFPLLVGNHVLGGGGFGSRLVDEIREKRGYAYSVASVLEPRRQAGPFVIALQTRGKQAEEAMALARETLERFREQGPTAEELRRAQDNIAQGFGLRLDSNRKLIGYVSMMGYYNLPTDWLERYPQAVRAVTPQQVQDAFTRRIDPARLVTVRVGGDGDR